ncbi:hypothetical protein DSL72_001292 [Monilinia vaccinii-corymbosi]|uniref:Uncharacterized protein n=1 Tax=Monilinia vaccinii-corymbosi TaxID=61207 RepID=A0A8A3P1F7_9HELO|nr:hypothetical protein DSL72_001292 [Monilinia vaccinii-corymbosi]
MENSLHSRNLYNTSPRTPSRDSSVNGSYDGLYGKQDQLKSSSSLSDTTLSEDSRVPLSENYYSTQLHSHPRLHRPARLDWHQSGLVDQSEGLTSKNLANDQWLKVRRALAASDSDDDTESPKEQKSTPHNTPSKLPPGHHEALESFKSFSLQESRSLPTTPTNHQESYDITYTISEFESPASSPATICIYPSPTESFTTSNITPAPSPSPSPFRAVSIPLQRRAIARKQNQAQDTYIVLHDSVPLAAESLSTTTITGVYTTLEEANGFVERIAEETCRDVPEEHFRLLVEEDGEYGFDILDLERHVLHRVYIEKQAIRGEWSEMTDIEGMGLMRGKANDEDIFDGLAKLSL